MKAIVLTLCFSSFGCASLIRAVTVDSPRANKNQLQTAQIINKENKETVPVIVGAQTDKQDKITQVAKEAFSILAQTRTKEQAEAVLNVAVEAIEGIRKADGTAETIRGLNSDTLDKILFMRDGQFAIATLAQAYTSAGNIDKSREYAKLGFQWTKEKIAQAGGLAAIVMGLGSGLGLFIKKAGDRKKLLYADAKVIRNHMTDRMKVDLTEEHSKLKINAKKEHGLI